jgi:23S rRNA pseudouridine1911/1915/1917 synthase
VEPLHFEVALAHAKIRVDKLVVQLLAEAGVPTPRAEVQRWIVEGCVLANGQPVDKKQKLEPGTQLAITPAPPPLSEALPDPSVPFEVVFEDAYLLVVDKPTGVVVHPARGHATGTLVNGLLARGGFEAGNADPRDPTGHLRPGIVHRIDKDTSGLLVVAKDAKTREGLQELFARHDITRSYLAIAVGEVRAARFDTMHGRHPKSRLRYTSFPRGDRPHPRDVGKQSGADRPGTRRAVTEVSPVRALRGATLVRCTLHTGRTHQIRVHMAEQAKAPILGDALYGGLPGNPELRQIAEQLGRQALHAAVLGFVHPITGLAMRWESQQPADLQRAVDALTKPST